MIQFRAIGGILRLLIFDNKMEWRTTSNALIAKEETRKTILEGNYQLV